MTGGGDARDQLPGPLNGREYHLRAREFDPQFTILRAHWLEGLKNEQMFFFLCADEQDGLHEKGSP